MIDVELTKEFLRAMLSTTETENLKVMRESFVGLIADLDREIANREGQRTESVPRSEAEH